MKAAALAATLAFASAGAAAADIYPSSSPTPLAAGLASQPIGHYEFCGRLPEECLEVGDRGPAPLDRRAWELLVEVNARVNAEVEAVEDIDNHGRSEWWSFPDNGRGDCEDHALEKRRVLIDEHGFHPSSLLMTVVRKRGGRGHAVLTARTDRGDYILDNLTDEVMPWQEARDLRRYRFLKRVHAAHAGRWVDVDPAAAAPAATGVGAIRVGHSD